MPSNPRTSRRRRDRAATATVGDLLSGYRSSCVLIAACELGVISALGDGGRELAALSASLGCDRDALARLLAALEALGVVVRRGDRVTLTPRGRPLLPGASTLADAATLAIREYLPLWSRLAQSVRSGKAAAPAILGGSSWEHRARDPVVNAAFNRMMSAGQARTAAALVRAIDLPETATLVDIGGGNGALLLELLQRLPRARGIVLELPHVARAARGVIRAAGLTARCRARSGSYFERLPAGADAYLLQYILHDLDDMRALALLARVRDALRPGKALWVIENVLPENRPAATDLVLLDLHMLVMHGGRERTRSQFAALFAGAGLRLARCRHLTGTRHLLSVERSD